MDLGSKKVIVLLVIKTLHNLGNDPKTLGRSLREVVEALVALVGLQGVKPREFFRSWRTHFTLHKQHVEPNHVCPSIRRHLEHNEPVVVDDVPKELVQ